MARKREFSSAPDSGKPSEPSPAIGPDGFPIGPDGYAEAIITWKPPSHARRPTLEDWLDDVVPRAVQGKKESHKAYARRLAGIAENEGMSTTAGSLETLLSVRRRQNQKS
jgi:hypothetical protein